MATTPKPYLFAVAHSVQHDRVGEHRYHQGGDGSIRAGNWRTLRSTIVSADRVSPRGAR